MKPDNERKIPVHVAIIMDGNGRWARKRGLPRTVGHTQGARTVEQILEDADHMGIRSVWRSARGITSRSG